MCTALSFKSKAHYFGRTLDLDYRYNEEVVVTPRSYNINFKNEGSKKTKYSIIGMGMVIDSFPLYYEASNEKGLAIAGLNFPDNAKYFDVKEDKLNLAVFELIPYLLGQYDSVKNAKDAIESLNITNQNFNENMISSPLHWMLADKNDCLVFEQTEKGLEIYDNPERVMTNNPTFKYQKESLEKIKNLSPEHKDAPHNNGVSFNCVGYGSFGLPGDYTSNSRFLKAAYLNKYALRYQTENENVAQFFHILDSVSFVEGSVSAKNNRNDITVYSASINTDEGIYYYKTYSNNQINAVRLTEENMTAKTLTEYKLQEEQNIAFQN